MSQKVPKPKVTYKFIEKKIDLRRYHRHERHLFLTQKGEMTVFAKEVTLLCKTLLPLADKHGGLADKELRYRKRWLDLISHPEVAQLFRKRTQHSPTNPSLFLGKSLS